MVTASGSTKCGSGKRWLSPLKIGFSMILVVLMWGMYLLSQTQIKYSTINVKESDLLKGEIIKLSKKYIHALSAEKETTQIGHTNTQQTAVLLQSMLSRIEQLETQMETVITNSTNTFAHMVKFIQNLNDSIHQVNNRSSHNIITYCEVPEDPTYPHCGGKVEWLKGNWKRFKKFSQHGVNGTVCSFLIFLSRIEDHCPKHFKITYQRMGKQDTLAQLTSKVNAAGSAINPVSSADDNLVTDDCSSYINDAAYPHCKNKVKWMKSFWKSDPVYASHGVNGSVCSFVEYLSQIETWCPLMKGSIAVPESCTIPKSTAFPHCGEKAIWMRKFWTTDKCYRELGVNGSVCSFLVYLSESEAWCPLRPGRTHIAQIAEARADKGKPDLSQTNLLGLLAILATGGERLKFQWMSDRITRLWPDWLKGFSSLKKRLKLDTYERKKILIYIGFLADEPLYHFGAFAGKGGPVGELVQWSDIIASLHILGHELVIVTSKNPKHKHGIKSILSSSVGGACPNSKSSEFDLIYTDYIGLSHILRVYKNINNLRCHLRLVDSFGTEAQFNHKQDGSTKNIYGFHNLNLKQYNTMFPHSPDNTFLGFVVENHISPSEELHKKKIALVYGKHISMWQDHKKLMFLDTIQSYFEIHATVGNPGKEKSTLTYALPSFVKNHGVLKGEEIQKLLKETTLFVGLGFPYEGPAPLEAVANGCFFLNAKIQPSIGRENNAFFKSKPTLRKLTSQHPYAEMYIGAPYVYTLELSNTTAIKQMMEEIKNKKLRPYLPFEYTYEGMLERLFALTKYQNFCATTKTAKSSNSAPAKVVWPPLSAKTVFLGESNEGCDQVCFKQGLICEPSFFPGINSAKSFDKCPKETPIPSIIAPGVKVGVNGDPVECLLQSNVLLYSCTARSPSTRRLCPCRDFVKGQTALCRDCLAGDR